MNLAAIAAAAAAAAGEEPSLPPSLEGPPPPEEPPQEPPVESPQSGPTRPSETQSPTQQPSGPSQVATLFVSGLPGDLKQRELHTLFRPFPGYEGSTMKFMGDFGKVVAFVSFSSQDQALKAKEELNGLQYDPDNAHTILRIELAKSNTRSKRPHEPAAEYEKKQPRYERERDAYPPAPYRATPSAPPPPPASSAFPYGTDPYAPNPPSLVPGAPPAHHSADRPGRTPNAPCNTIFVSNLPSSVTEDHLKALYANLGQKRVRLLPKGSSLVAFIEFESIEQAQYAISVTNAYEFMGNSLRVEYAKAPMGQPMRRSHA